MLADQIEKLADEARMLWFEALSEANNNGFDPLVILMAQVASGSGDAALIASHPGLKPVMCIQGDGDEYRHAAGCQAHYTLCGVVYAARVQVVQSHQRVPTCSKCIAILTQKDGLR